MKGLYSLHCRPNFVLQEVVWKVVALWLVAPPFDGFEGCRPGSTLHMWCIRNCNSRTDAPPKRFRHLLWHSRGKPWWEDPCHGTIHCEALEGPDFWTYPKGKKTQQLPLPAISYFGPQQLPNSFDTGVSWKTWTGKKLCFHKHLQMYSKRNCTGPHVILDKSKMLLRRILPRCYLDKIYQEVLWILLRGYLDKF